MTCTPGTYTRLIRFHPDLLPLRNRIMEDGKKNGQGTNKTIMAILADYYAKKDAEEKKKTITR